MNRDETKHVASVVDSLWPNRIDFSTETIDEWATLLGDVACDEAVEQARRMAQEARPHPPTPGELFAAARDAAGKRAAALRAAAGLPGATHGALCLYCGRVGHHTGWCYRGGAGTKYYDPAGNPIVLTLHRQYRESWPGMLPNELMHPYQDPDAPVAGRVPTVGTAL